MQYSFISKQLSSKTYSGQPNAKQTVKKNLDEKKQKKKTTKHTDKVLRPSKHFTD